jgi:hypothetical protein
VQLDVGGALGSVARCITGGMRCFRVNTVLWSAFDAMCSMVFTFF